MARKPDTPCQSCGRLLYRDTGSRDRPTCRDCRQKRRKTIARSVALDLRALRPFVVGAARISVGESALSELLAS